MARGNPENLRAAARRKSEAATSRGELAIRQMVKEAEPSENGIIRTLTAQLSELKQRHRTETHQLKAALAAAQGEILVLKRGIPRR
jgi:hypothetical protein